MNVTVETRNIYADGTRGNFGKLFGRVTIKGTLSTDECARKSILSINFCGLPLEEVLTEIARKEDHRIIEERFRGDLRDVKFLRKKFADYCGGNLSTWYNEAQAMRTDMLPRTTTAKAALPTK